MSPLRLLIRLSGLAFLLVVPLYILVLATHGADTEAGRMLLPQWKLAHQAEGCLYGLLTLAVVGLYLPQAEQAGKLGLAGFVLALLGCAFIFNESLLYHAYLLGFLQSQHPVLLSPAQWYAPTGPLGPEVAMVSRLYLAALAGLGLLGAATVRAAVLPRWPALLLAAGQAISLGYGLAPDTWQPTLFPLSVAGYLAILVSYAWFGLVLARGSDRSTAGRSWRMTADARP